MRISIRVKPNSKNTEVEKLGDKEFVVRVKAPPKEGKANIELAKALSRHFDIPKSRITIVRGEGSRIKIIDIS